MAAPQKISLYSLSELKSTLDDHLPVFLSSASTPSNVPLPRALRFTPSYHTTAIRLALGYAAVAVALYIFYLDYVKKVEFEDIKLLTAVSVGAYFVLNSALTLWIWLGEKGLVFEGSRADSKTKRMTSLKIHSHPPHKKYEPSYRMTSSWNAAGRKGEKELTVPFTRFFSADGFFVPAAFETFLKQELPVIEGGAPNPTEKGMASGNTLTGQTSGPKLSSGTRVRLDEDEGLLVLDDASTPRARHPSKRKV